MAIRPSVKDKNCNVNVHIGSEYDVVKYVADNMELLKDLGDSAIIFQRYLGEHDVAPTHRHDGSEIQSGDYYLNTTNNSVCYALVDNKIITWVEVDFLAIQAAATQANIAMGRAEAASASALESKETTETNTQIAVHAKNDAITAKNSIVESHREVLEAKVDVLQNKNAVDTAKDFVDTAANEVRNNKDIVVTSAEQVETDKNTSVAAATHANNSKRLAEEWAVSTSTNNSAKYWAEEAKKAATTTVVNGGPFKPTAAKEYPDIPDGLTQDIYFIVFFDSFDDTYVFTGGELVGQTVWTWRSM